MTSHMPINTSIYACLYACLYGCLYTCLYTCLHTCLHTWPYACPYTCPCTCLYTCLCTCLFAPHRFPTQKKTFLSDGSRVEFCGAECGMGPPERALATVSNDRFPKKSFRTARGACPPHACCMYTNIAFLQNKIKTFLTK